MATMRRHKGHYLMERYLFTYLTSGRDLLRFEDKRLAPRAPPLVLAAPAFDGAIASTLPEGTHRGLRSVDMVTQPLPPLENTAEEARTIARLFPNAQVLLGAQATEGALKAVHAPRVLHLATHGFFLPEQPLPEVLLHGPGGEPTPAELHAGAGRSEAMREVQLAMLSQPETAHPNLWASFVVSGDWRTLEGEARLPQVGKVMPGPRGCACGQAGSEGSGYAAWLSLAVSLLAVGRRRRHGAEIRTSPGPRRDVLDRLPASSLAGPLRRG